MPKFCIVIPTYNSEKTILPAVLSALDQSFKDFSVIVSDNASNDKTKEILSAIGSKKLIYIQNNVFLNKSESWNRAYNQAVDCDYLVNLHSDDILDPHCLMTISKHLSRKPAFIHGACKKINYEGAETGKNYFYPFSYSLCGEGLKELLVLNNQVGIVGVAINKEFFDRSHKWSCDLNFFQDVHLWMHLSELGNNLYIPTIFGSYRAPKNFTPGAYINEMVGWYEAIIKNESNFTIKLAAINSLENKIKKIINSSACLIDKDLSDFLLNKLYNLNNEEFLRFNIYLRSNIIKAKSSFQFYTRKLRLIG